jgi:hypothetical protein
MPGREDRQNEPEMAPGGRAASFPEGSNGLESSLRAVRHIDHHLGQFGV